MKNNIFTLLATTLLAVTAHSADQQHYETPPQDQGLPYTRSSRSTALSLLQNGFGLFDGSRYGVVKGHRVRLSDEDLIGAEAFRQDKAFYVPLSFARLLTGKQINFPAIPADLSTIAPRWVYSPNELMTGETSYAQLSDLPSGVQILTRKGISYVDIIGLAKALGMTYAQDPRGLVVIGEKEFDFSKLSPVQLDSLITLFDTPEKFADPDIATRSIPSLAAQGSWKTHAKASPEALKLYEGPETDWPSTPKSEYDLSGFNTALLGSPVPPPGVYPRLLFSEQDLPMLYKRLQESVIGRMSLTEIEELFKKSWWDPKTSDGQVFEKLASGHFTEADFLDKDGHSPSGLPTTMTGQKQGIYNSHVNYITNCLTTMALYALLTGNDELGKKVANAIANFMAFNAETRLDNFLKISDSEYGSTAGSGSCETGWRAVCGIVSSWDLPFMLDFAGKWMTAEQKDTMRRIIAKAIYGRRDTHQAGPISWRENNHATWHESNFLAAMAIEGLPGCDPELFPEAVHHVRAFLDYGIDPTGQIFESNGKNGGGLNVQVLNMIALARRGENMWGNPHWRNLLKSQVQNTSPSGHITVSSGTFSGSPLSFQIVSYFKAFYPDNLCADYLLSTHFPELDPSKVNLDDYRAKIQADKIPALRLPGPTYSGFVRTFLYDTDWKVATRSELNLPLTYSTDVHGILSAYSDSTPQATWINLHVRPNQYYGAGHHHNDAGMIHFSSGGKDWITDTPYFGQSYSGRFHNEVLVDGIAEYEKGWGAPGKWLGASGGKEASFASCDLAYAYSWRWMTQAPQGKWDATNEVATKDWELDTSSNAVAHFKGTQRWKMRPWWPGYTFSNWFPVLRTPWNPMEYVFRSAGLVRGTHPFGLVVDDLKKNQQPHLYEWTAMLNKGVWQADVLGLPEGWIALGSYPVDPNVKSLSADAKPLLKPANGEPILYVVALGGDGKSAHFIKPVVETRSDGEQGKDQKMTYYDRLTIAQNGKVARFKVLLLPGVMGDPPPKVTYDSTKQIIVVQFKGETTRMTFLPDSFGRTKLHITRGDEKLLSEK